MISMPADYAASMSCRLMDSKWLWLTGCQPNSRLTAPRHTARSPPREPGLCLNGFAGTYLPVTLIIGIGQTAHVTISDLFKQLRSF